MNSAHASSNITNFEQWVVPASVHRALWQRRYITRTLETAVRKYERSDRVGSLNEREPLEIWEFFISVHNFFDAVKEARKSPTGCEHLRAYITVLKSAASAQLFQAFLQIFDFRRNGMSS